MTDRKLGKILSEHEERLVEAGLDKEQAAALVDELEDELNSLFEGEEEETDQQGAGDDEESDTPEND